MSGTADISWDAFFNGKLSVEVMSAEECREFANAVLEHFRDAHRNVTDFDGVIVGEEFFAPYYSPRSWEEGGHISSNGGCFCTRPSMRHRGTFYLRWFYGHSWGKDMCNIQCSVSVADFIGAVSEPECEVAVVDADVSGLFW